MIDLMHHKRLGSGCILASVAALLLLLTALDWHCFLQSTMDGRMEGRKGCYSICRLSC